MGVSFARNKHHATVLDGYRRLLVPVVDNIESEEAVDVAARLAAEHGSSITAIAVVEVPPVLPADAHMHEEEARARAVLGRAAAVAERYGVSVTLRTVQTRDAASAIVSEVVAREIELVIIGAPRRLHSATVSTTVQHVLRKAPCRVMIVGAGPQRHAA